MLSSDVRRPRAALPGMQWLARYHRHSVVGMQHVPGSGPALLVMPHAMLTYDSLLLQAAVLHGTGRLPCGLGDRFWSTWLRAGPFMESHGIYNANPGTARELLNAGELVGVMPGGKREALRPSTERGQIRWEGRTGFARLALETGAPVILAVCPAADYALTVRASATTDYVYQKWRVALPKMRGIGPTWIPRPVQLTHHLYPPITPPRCRGTTPGEDEVKAFHSVVKAKMLACLGEHASARNVSR